MTEEEFEKALIQLEIDNQERRLFLDKYIDTLVIDNFKIVMLINLHEDPEDWYWEYFDLRESYKSSAVGQCTPLKGIIPEDEYNRLVYVWNLNSWNPDHVAI